MTSFVGCFSVRKTLVCFNICPQNPYLFRIPSHSTDSFATHVVEGQTLLLCFDVPHGHKASIAASDQDVCNSFIPVQTFDIIRAGSGASQSERVFDIVKIGDVELHKSISKTNNKLGISIFNTSPFVPPVASRFGCLGLN